MTTSEVIPVIASFSGNVAAGLLATFLYDAIVNGKIKRLVIRGKTITTREEISKELMGSESDVPNTAKEADTHE